MEDLSLHILDIVENSITAGAQLVTITLSEDEEDDILSIEIADDGSGMPEEILKKATDPFFTEKTTRKVGLGLSLLQQAARMANGDFSIESREGGGTTVKANFQHSHIDRQPLGDIAETIESLVIGNPAVDFSFIHRKNGKSRIFDTRKIREKLSEVSMSSPQGIAIIRESLKKTEGFLLEAE